LEVVKIVPASGKQEWEQFLFYLHKEFNDLKKEKFLYHIEPCEEGRYVLTSDNFPGHITDSEGLNTYRHFFCTALSEYIVEYLEKEIVERMIRSDFAFELPEQIKRIYKYCYYLLFLHEDHDERDDLKIAGRKCKIFKRAYEYLEEEREFNIDGFIRFRLKEYREELAEVIEYAIDEYILDKEYQDFIQLLKFFISKQDSKLPFLHVYHIKDRQFLLFDEQGNKVTDDEVEAYLEQWANHSLSYEDIIVSTLITINPKKMILHTNEPGFTVIQTLKTIFTEQLTICTKCNYCQLWKETKNKLHT
jgi:putative sporulation protein YtxC